MKNLQNHFSGTKFHSCRSSFPSKKKTDLLAYSHLKIPEITTTIFGLSGVQETIQEIQTWKLF
jgi:hypothetical protein